MKSKNSKPNNCNTAKNTSAKTNFSSARRSQHDKQYRDKTNKDGDSRKAMDYAKKEAFSNDPAWYASDPSLARDSASIPFSWATGTTTTVGNNLPLFFSWNGPATFSAPGVCAIYLRSSVGNAASPTDPINVAATAVYSYVRHANSGSANYDSPDLMLYIIAMGEVISFTNFLIRAYGITSVYSSRNRYLPDALLGTMGIDAEDLRQHLADFRYGINVAMNKISSLAVPSTMSYFKRKAFLYSGIYTEGTSAKDQLYAYVPESVFKLGKDTDGAFQLLRTQFYSSGKKYTASELLNFLNAMIDPMIKSEDINIMSGDILKAYGTDGILKFGRVDENYFTPITFDIGVLEQMKNVKTSPETLVSHATIGNVAQDATKGYLVSNETIDYTTIEPDLVYKDQIMLAAQDKILTTTTADVGPDLVLESTRLMLAAAWNDSTSTLTLYPATEVAVWVGYCVMNDATVLEGDYSVLMTTTNTVLNVSATVTQMANYLFINQYIPAFKFSPEHSFFAMSVSGQDAGKITNAYRALSFDNYAVLTNEDLRRMNEACLLNMMHVPAIGSIF